MEKRVYNERHLRIFVADGADPVGAGDSCTGPLQVILSTGFTHSLTTRFAKCSSIDDSSQAGPASGTTSSVVSDPFFRLLLLFTIAATLEGSFLT